jgi:hypothetical protein
VAPPGSEYRLRGSQPPTAAAVAVCRYDDGGSVYLFACGTGWEVVQDWDCGDVDDATEMATRYVLGHAINWQSR